MQFACVCAIQVIQDFDEISESVMYRTGKNLLTVESDDRVP